MNTSSPNKVNQSNSPISVNNDKILARGKSVLNQGEVALVGSGPGDAELLTIRAMRFIEQAEIAIYDRLVSDEILALLPDNCERFYVGKEQAKHCVPQDKINEI
ncbi:MAG: SAM-dependent methyltransferase, partial [Colwellia sp.]